MKYIQLSVAEVLSKVSHIFELEARIDQDETYFN
jgi:hypothetical protein